jgi:ATP-dependent DNA helicase RecG
LVGVKDKVGTITGLTQDQIEYADRKIAEYADNLKPPIYVATEVVKVDVDGLLKNVLAVHIKEGVNKPYKTPQGEIYVKQGSNKRLLTENSEIMRLFQSSGNLLADEMEVYGTSIEDLSESRFAKYFAKEFGRRYREMGLTLEQALRAKRVLRNGQLTLAGLLFFGEDPQAVKPAFSIKAACYLGNEVSDLQYRNKRELKGTIQELFQQGMDFFEGYLYHLQSGESFNSPAVMEISKVTLEELLQNALLHRDYFKNAPVRLLIFDNRIELISPGKLPNSLTVEGIKFGNPVVRNNQLVAFGSHLLPYSGLGSGIRRAIREEPRLELVNDVDGEQFIASIPRPEKKFDTQHT